MIQEKTAPASTQTSIATLMQNYVNYNLWANTTLVNWLRSKPAEMLEQEVASSFPSIKLTLIHTWQTQRYWLSLIRRDEPDTFSGFEGSVEDILDIIVEHSQELADFVQHAGERGVTSRTLVVSPWFQSDFQNFEYIMHVVNHTTYHRGQIITIGRQLGFTDAPMTDYNYYNVFRHEK
ncbi:DinB family protein [Chitinophaga cymbidii]|uniref:Protein DinB n=1 Tax=Chitinophaga cymbidii TaxID=1096750 RepID=A0A512RFJ8_9BACT|nr:DinB family protein [Chitinophaga cymbidii]GEP94471.1 protein DinB [Chitinophaga cymbidii]